MDTLTTVYNLLFTFGAALLLYALLIDNLALLIRPKTAPQRNVRPQTLARNAAIRNLRATVVRTMPAMNETRRRAS